MPSVCRRWWIVSLIWSRRTSPRAPPSPRSVPKLGRSKSKVNLPTFLTAGTPRIGRILISRPRLASRWDGPVASAAWRAVSLAGISLLVETSSLCVRRRPARTPAHPETSPRFRGVLAVDPSRIRTGDCGLRAGKTAWPVFISVGKLAGSVSLPIRELGVRIRIADDRRRALEGTAT